MSQISGAGGSSAASHTSGAAPPTHASAARELPEGAVDATIELEHAIGFAGSVPGALLYHPNGKDFIYVAGGCVVICDFTDPHNQVFLRGHDGNISCLAMSASGRYLASGQYGENADVVVWDYENKKLLYRLCEHDFGIQDIAFSDDERLLATVGDVRDKKMFVWDLATGYINASVNQTPLPTERVAFGGMVKNIKRRETTNYQLVTCGDKKIFLWALNPISGELSAAPVSMHAFVRDFTCLLFSADREWLFAGTTTGDFACINVKNKLHQHAVHVCSGGVHSLALAAGGRVVAGGGDGSVLVFQGGGRDWVDEGIISLSGSVKSVHASPDGSEVLCGTSEGFIHRVRVGSGTLAALLVAENHAHAGAGLGESAGSSASAAGSLMSDGGAAKPASSFVGGVVSVSYAADVSDKFATVSEDNTVRIWDASDYTVPVKAFVKDGGHPTSVAYSLDALLSGWEDGQLRCHHADTGEHLWSVADAHRGGITSVLISNNQRFCLTGGVAGEVRVWELRSREMVSHLKEHTMGVTRLCLFDDDVHALSCSRDRSFLCWDLKREKRISSHTQRMGAIHSVALSRDQSLVMTVGQEKRITYWDLRTPEPVMVIDKAHSDGDAEATAIAVAGSLDVFATGGSDASVKLWDVRMGLCLSEGVGHSGTIRDLKFSPDDRQLTSVAQDGGIFVWNVYA